MERDPHLGDAIQPLGEEGGLLCFRCPETEYNWWVRTLLSLGPDAEVLAPEALRQRVRKAALDIAQRYTAALAGLLLKHDIQHPWLETASQFCWRALASTETTEFHTLMPAITFLEHTPS